MAIKSIFQEKMRFFLCKCLQGPSPNDDMYYQQYQSCILFQLRHDTPSIIDLVKHLHSLFLGSLWVGFDLASWGSVYRDFTVVEIDAQSQLLLRSEPKLFQVLLTQPVSLIRACPVGTKALY